MPVIVLVAALAAAFAQSPRDARAPDAASAAMSGRVIARDTRRPMPRAVVSVQLKGASQPRQTIADEQGRYAFDDLDAGEYALWAAPGELVATHLAQAYGESAPVTPTMPPRPRITLARGERRAGLDIALPRALAIEGRVSDPWDDPVADAEVTVRRPDRAPVLVGSTAYAYTDDRGEYRVFGLAPGRYHVCAAPSVWFPVHSDAGSEAVRTCHLAAVSESNAADVLLEGEDRTGIDIHVQTAGTYSAAGSVVDAAGKPVDGASVDASRDDGLDNAQATSREGSFVLTGLTPGRYLVKAAMGGRLNPNDPRPPATERVWGYTTMEVDSGDVSNVVITVAKPHRVTGRVLFDETPAPGRLHMIVEMQEALNRFYLFASVFPSGGAVDDRLNFEVGDLYRLPLIVGMRGLPDGWLVRSVRFDGRDVTDQPVDFGAPTGTPRLDIHVTNRVARPRVRVTDDDGRPVTTYQVVLIPADPARSAGTRFGQPDTPSDEGVVALGPTLPGEYLIAALAWDDFNVLLEERARLESLRSSARRITLAEGDDRLLELRLTRLPAARQ